ncbi:9231_t:CDS:1, partial [Gigaspora rosea]
DSSVTDTDIVMGVVEPSDYAEDLVKEGQSVGIMSQQTEAEESVVKEPAPKQAEVVGRNMEERITNVRPIEFKGNHSTVATVQPVGLEVNKANMAQKTERRQDQDEEGFIEVKSNQKKKRKVTLR